MKRHTRSITIILLSMLLLTAGYLKATSAEKNGTEKPGAGAGNIRDSGEYIEYSKTFRDNTSASYNPETYKELTFEKVYGQKVEPPVLDLDADLSGKALSELQLLRNTVYARRGYLFMDSVIRGYFNKFPWYQPVFWDSSFKMVLSKDEEAFIERVKAEEALRLKDNSVRINGAMLGNTANIVNREMFKTMPDKARSLLKEQNFFLNESKYEQLYWVYDDNNYKGIPGYVTTDLYLDLLHVYYKHLLMGLEKYDLYPLAKSLVKGMYEKTLAAYSDKSTSTDLKPSLEFNLVYLAVAGNLLEQGSISPPAGILEEYKKEYRACMEAKDVGSSFLNYAYFDYSQLKVRGSYAEDKNLGFYFQGVKWLVTAPMFYMDNNGLRSAALFAHILKDNPDLLGQYNRLESILSSFTGEGDNLSPIDILSIFKEDSRFSDLSSLTDKGLLAELEKRLKAIDPEKMKAKGGTKEIATEIAKSRILFFPLRYNLDGYILQNMVNPALAGGGARLYPRGLDIFASFGNNEARKILLEEYKETETWPGYADALKKMEGEFAGFKDWDRNLFNRRMGLILDITRSEKDYPGFMQTSSWQRRALMDALAGWTEIKNELILYQKQPMAAEKGEGGLTPPEPVTPGYVEPNVTFWAGCLDLLDRTQGILASEGFLTTERRGVLARLYIMSEDLLTISRKELKGETVSDSEFKSIEFLGARAEYLAKSMRGEWDSYEGMGLAADVYSYYGPGESYCLEETVGNADIIWVVAKINGLLYLTRGATFSYYEFTEPVASRLTDGEWRSRLANNQAPERPVWTKGLYAPTGPEINTSYGDTSYPVSGKWLY